MFRSAFNSTIHAIPLLLRALAIVGALAAPVMAVPLVQGGEHPTIEAPALKKTGMGFVLMVSLQRA